MSTVIDVHTHMLNADWLALLRDHGTPRYTVAPSKDGPPAVFFDGAPFMTLMPGHMDYALRIKDMDAARVDLAIVSLTCPNVFWGGPEISLKAARLVNDDMAEAQARYPSRIRWLASIPWEYPELAVAELERAVARGAVGVMVLANIAGRPLTDPLFEPVWRAIDDRALPVLIHPTAPPGTNEMDIRVFNLVASVGFTFDTTLAVSRMIYDGFFDRFEKVKIIASHGGGTLPYLAGRLDRLHECTAAARAKIAQPPSTYLRRIYYDAVVYTPEALELCLAVGGEDNVMYGSDYPHNIGDMKGCLERVDARPPGQVKKLRHANAQRIFGL